MSNQRQLKDFLKMKKYPKFLTEEQKKTSLTKLYMKNQNNPSKSATYGTFRSSSESAKYRTAKPNSVPAATTSTGNTQMTPIVMAKILNKARDNFASSSKNEGREQKESNFSRALKSMDEHKHS